MFQQVHMEQRHPAGGWTAESLLKGLEEVRVSELGFEEEIATDV